MSELVLEARTPLIAKSNARVLLDEVSLRGSESAVVTGPSMVVRSSASKFEGPMSVQGAFHRSE